MRDVRARCSLLGAAPSLNPGTLLCARLRASGLPPSRCLAAATPLPWLPCCLPTRRPTEVELLIGDPAKAAAELGWTASTTLDQLCEEMVKSDLDLLEKGDFTS